jgi:hypothetical protein
MTRDSYKARLDADLCPNRRPSLCIGSLGARRLRHVTGIVINISESSVTVKTTAGEIKVGDKNVIHAKEVNEKLVAHTVEVGSAVVAKH